MRKLNITKNQKGFTLVELLVAITILAIITLPLLHSFVTATKTNTKARKRLEANTVAENVMEKVKAMSLDDLKKEPYSLTLDNDTASATYGKYIATFKNETANGNAYNAQAIFDAEYYKSSGSSGNTFNDEKVADIYDMDVLKDGFYVQGSEQDDECVTKLLTEYNNKHTSQKMTEASVRSLMTRTATITIKTQASGTKKRTNVMVDYLYEYGDVSTTMTSQIYDNTDITDGSLRAVYLFYTPLYTSQSSTSPKDHIEIKNMNDTPVTVYLVKQSTSSDTTTLNEKNYKVALSVEDGGTTGGNEWNKDGYQAATTIRTNIGWSVLKNSDDKYDQIITQPVLSYTHNAKKLTGYNVTAIDTDSASVQAIKNYLDWQSLSGEETQPRIYSVEVKVYQMDADHPFDDSNYILSYTGSKE